MFLQKASLTAYLLQLLEREKTIFFVCVFTRFEGFWIEWKQTNSCSFLTKGCGPAQPDLWCGPPKTTTIFYVAP